MASGQCFAQADVKEATMLALVLNRSSRVIPKTQPGQDFKLPTVTIMGRKSNQIQYSALDRHTSASGSTDQEQILQLQ